MSTVLPVPLSLEPFNLNALHLELRVSIRYLTIFAGVPEGGLVAPIVVGHASLYAVASFCSLPLACVAWLFGFTICLRDLNIVSSNPRAGTPMHNETPMLMRYVDKIAASPVLRGSEGLCKLLHHLAETAVQEPPVSTSEFRIATEVLGRRSDFNPKIDSSVRAQISRLRSKLEEYYTTIGAEDEIIIDMPRRGWGLTFQKRKLPPNPPSRPPPLILSPPITGALPLP